MPIPIARTCDSVPRISSLLSMNTPSVISISRFFVGIWYCSMKFDRSKMNVGFLSCTGETFTLIIPSKP